MQITVNGQKHEFDMPLNLAALVEELKLNLKQVAIEHNREIVPRSRFDQVALNEGDQVEIVHFIGGG